MHHIEDGYSFEGNDVDINYDYEVVGRDANFGLMIFINGIPQMIKHEDKESLVYTFKGKKTLIKLSMFLLCLILVVKVIIFICMLFNS